MSPGVRCGAGEASRATEATGKGNPGGRLALGRKNKEGRRGLSYGQGPGAGCDVLLGSEGDPTLEAGRSPPAPLCSKVRSAFRSEMSR